MPTFALQVEDGSDVLVREQLEAAGMDTRQDRDRHAGIEATDERRREPQAKVDLAAFDRLRIRRTVFTRT